MLRQTPNLETLGLGDGLPWTDSALAELPREMRLTSLQLSPGWASLTALARWPQLRLLAFPGRTVPLANEDWAALGRHPGLRSLFLKHTLLPTSGSSVLPLFGVTRVALLEAGDAPELTDVPRLFPRVEHLSVAASGYSVDVTPLAPLNALKEVTLLQCAEAYGLDQLSPRVKVTRRPRPRD